MSSTDEQIRAALGSLADQAPMPPDIGAIRQSAAAPTRLGRRAVLVVGLVAAAVLLAFVVVRAGHDETPAASGGTTRLAPRDVPGDLRLVSAEDRDQLRYPGTSLTYTTGAKSFDEASRALAIHVTVVPDGVVDELRSHPSPSAERLQIRGREGELFDDDPSAIGVVWIEDNLIVSVDGHHLSRAEVLAAAESLEPVSDAEWARLRR